MCDVLCPEDQSVLGTIPEEKIKTLMPTIVWEFAFKGKVCPVCHKRWYLKLRAEKDPMEYQGKHAGW